MTCCQFQFCCESSNSCAFYILSTAYLEAMTKGFADQLDITQVHSIFDADVFFPKIDPKVWKLKVREDFKADEKNMYNYSFLRYRRIT